MMREGLLKENIDGEALTWAHNRIAPARTTQDPDGKSRTARPVDDSTRR